MSLPPPLAAERHAGPRPVRRTTTHRRGRHRGRRWVALGILALAVGYGVRVTQVLLAARADAAALRHDLDRVDLSGSVRALLKGESSPDIQRLAGSTARLRVRLGSAWLRPLGLLPVVGRQIDAARSLTSVPEGFLQAAQVTGSEVRLVRLTPGARDLRTLVDTAGRAVDRFDDLVTHADLGPSDGLVSSIGSARSEVAAQLERVKPTLDRAAVALPGLQALVTGHRTLLLAAANNAEMGAGAGAPLAVATLTLNDGRPTIGDWTWTGSVAVPDGVGVPEQLAGPWGFVEPQADLRTAVVSPSFDQVGTLLAAQWKAATGASVDGVILLDVAGMQSLVDALGPTALDGTGLDRASLARTLLHDQYIGVTNEAPATGDARRDRMAALGGLVATRALDGGEDWTGMLDGLATATRGRHLLAWSGDVTMQRTWTALGAGGVLQPDSLLVSVQNRGANKLDWFLDVKGAVTVTPIDAGTLEVAVRVDLANQVPSGESRYIAGPFAEGPYGRYAGYLTVNVPGSATEVAIDGGPALLVDHADGATRVIGQVVTLERGATTSVTVRWHQSTTIGLTVEPSGRYPGITWTASGRTWTDDAPHQVLAEASS